jgi:HAD superfamily hydrolase (TIGR01549 family)
MNNIKAVLFNIDDTLFDNRYSVREGLRVVWSRFTCFHELTIDDMEKEYLTVLEEMRFSHVIFGRLTQNEMRDEIFKYLFLNRGIEIDFHTSNNAAELFRNKYVRIRRVTKGSEELLAALAPLYKIGVVTNNSDDEAEDKLGFTGYDKYISAVTTSQETGVGKPTARIFRIALEKLGVNADEAVMIGNSWNWDILGAHELGMKCIWLNNYNRPHHNPEIAAEVKSLEDAALVLRLIENYK